jgi:hypothetical protein
LIRRLIWGDKLNPSFIIEVIYHEKHRLGPQNGPGSSRTKKMLKIVSFEKTVLSQLDKVDGHRDPPVSSHVLSI